MNHLAHFFLAERSPEAATGAFLGDFVKGKISEKAFPPAMCVEIMIHRHVDAFTDTDANVQTGKNLFVKTRRRFAGIALDVGFDHFLAKNWNDYTSEDLHDFAAEIYQSLESNKTRFPMSFQTVLPRMIADDWLAAYTDFERVKFALERLSTRVRGGASLTEAASEIVVNFDFYEDLFKEFFPRLQDFAIKKRNDLTKNI
jgi:acyl carrier protein phosphodiesterase